MKLTLNQKAFTFAQSLISLGRVCYLSSDEQNCNNVNCDPAFPISTYIGNNGFGAYSQWCLIEDTDITDPNTLERYSGIFTDDFWSICRDDLVEIQQDATAQDLKEIADACAALIAQIDMKQMSKMQFSTLSINASTAADKKGWKWDVTIIKAGKTLTNPAVYVPVEALTASLDVFEGAKVYANSVADKAGHKSNRNEKVPSDIIAVLSKPYVQADEMHALMTILPSGAWLRDNLLALSENNLIDTVYQLSVDSSIDAKRSFVAAINETLPVVSRIVKADVDIVGEAAAGGRINKLAASKTNSHTHIGVTTMRQKLLSILFFFPALLAGKTNEDWNKVPENELYTHLLQAGKGFLPSSLPEGLTDKSADDLVASYRDQAEKLKTAKFENGLIVFQASKPPTDPQKNDTATVLSLQAALDEQKKLTEGIIKTQCATLLASRTESLPVPLKDALRKKFNDKIFSVAELESAITEGRELIAPFMASNMSGHGFDIKAGMDSYDKLQAATDLFFLASNQGLKPLKAGTEEYKKVAQGVSPFRSIKEFYIAATGDVNITGIQDRNARLTASLESSDWASIISTAMNKRLVQDYAQLNLDTWRQFVTLRDGVTNFKQQQTVRYGGYGNLPTVLEAGPYTGLASPSDEKATWSPTKKGGTEDITREMIMNDDVSAIQRIPTRLAKAAGQTLHEFVYNFIRPSVNPVIYDGVVLYHANHANTATTALAADGVALSAARLRMKKQTMLSSGKRLGIRAGFLIVPSDLETIAYGLLTPAYDKYNDIPTFLQKIGITPIVVDYWDDATDWVIAAQKGDTEMVEVGFVNGQETPQLFVSDMPNVGSMFTNDKITYKIRHEYGGAIVDYRGLDGSIVAG